MIIENLLTWVPLMAGLMFKPPNPFTRGTNDIWLAQAITDKKVYQKALMLMACDVLGLDKDEINNPSVTNLMNKYIEEVKLS